MNEFPSHSLPSSHSINQVAGLALFCSIFLRHRRNNHPSRHSTYSSTSTTPLSPPPLAVGPQIAHKFLSPSVLAARTVAAVNAGTLLTTGNRANGCPPPSAAAQHQPLPIRFVATQTNIDVRKRIGNWPMEVHQYTYWFNSLLIG